MKNLILLICFTIIANCVNAQFIIVKNNEAKARIITSKTDSVEIKAAGMLQKFVQKISDAHIEISNDDPKKGDIVICNNYLPKTIKTSEIKPDGFIIKVENEILYIAKGPGKGSIYAVVSLLEKEFGVKYYAVNAVDFEKKNNMQLAANYMLAENPTFRYRQTQAYSFDEDPLYKTWFRLDQPQEVFAGGYWVHTFDRIMPSAEFGVKHPEYYSFINGERRPGSASQWCLTNPKVFEIASQRIDSIFKANPGKNMISVSQNDGNNTNCACDKCKAIDDKEGTPAGSLIYFMNKLAQKFPNKEFSTLAYLYSVAPPKNIKPLPNVNIMLCDIDCYREVNLTENVSGKAFVKDMEGWAAITNNIFVWDYGINFDNYVSPFPNFHILQPNMQLFKQNSVNMHFSQIAGSKGGNFSELRSYVVAKLMWNVNADVDSLMHTFINGYYGSAAPYIYDYIKIQQGALLGSGVGLWIYDTPVTHKTGMLKPYLINAYKQLFDNAEKAVANNPKYLNRVRQERLSLQYADLEITRTNPITNPLVIEQELMLFKMRAAEFEITSLNERNNTINEYCDLYFQRNLAKTSQKNYAHGASITYTLPPNKPYDQIADKALTDGLYGGATFNESWVGWCGKDAEFIIDLGEQRDITSVEADFLHKVGAWIMLPKSMTCHASADGVNYTLMGKQDIAEDRAVEVKYVDVKVTSKQKARYIKVNIETIGLCPPWHYGVGFPAWFFVDEVKIY